MDALLPLAAKSLLIAGATLLLLKLMRRRSAADRSFVAHLGLAAIALLPVALLVLPRLEVESALIASDAPVALPAVPVTQEVASTAATFPGAASATPAFYSGIDWLFWLYAVPASLLLLFTLIALLRLVLLKAKANVLVEANWLTALARAQRRMGFKHGTALLTSDELKSPISWGLMRPVILLNNEAASAHDEAEAIIAHELAHVARLDWLKLLLSRVTVALFWFNPLVWLLAREAHQLREEAADDAVLGSNIEDTDYARLLVGIARHECRGLLIGAHGVAPARNSLARRVQRVLDAASERAPGGWRWASAAGIFAAGMAVPLAVLQLVPMAPAGASSATAVRLAATTPAAAASAVQPVAGATAATPAAAAIAATPAVVAINGKRVVATQDGDHHPDPDVNVDVDVDHDSIDDAIATSVATARSGSAVAVASASRATSDEAVDRAVRMKVHGITPDYVRAIRSASPRLSRATEGELVSMKVQGVTPEYVRGLAAAGYGNATPDQIIAAAVQGVDLKYVRGMAAAGLPGARFNELIELRIHGVQPRTVERYRNSGLTNLTAKQLITLSVNGVEPHDLKGADDDP